MPRLGSGPPPGASRSASSAVRFVSFGASHVGRRRKNNEDAYLCDDGAGVWLVADGVGGREAGEIASQTTVEAIQGELLRDLARAARADAQGSNTAQDAELRDANARRMMDRAIQAATYMVFGMALVDRDRMGMGTTVSALAVLGGRLVSGQVGDSRIYRIRRGVAHQLTEDHTWVNWAVQSGGMSREQAERAGKQHIITRAVGQRDYVEVDTAVWDAEVGDRYLLCSDGFHRYLRDGELPELLEGYRCNAVNGLVELANDRGGRDNITVVVVDVEGYLP